MGPGHIQQANPAEDRRDGMAKVTVTERAAEELHNVLTETAPEPDQTLRLLATPGGGLALGVDRLREGDEVIETQGADILVVASTLLDSLGDITIDCGEAPEGERPALLCIRR
jgi:Fe-S cluster assembly iron-binding protein IscA